jgi:hypothetical protein
MKKFLKTILYTAVLLISLNAFAGNDDNPDVLPGDPGDPVAPIDYYILPMLIVGISTAYFLKRRTSTEQVS